MCSITTRIFPIILLYFFSTLNNGKFFFSLIGINNLKPIYRADTKGAAEVALDELEAKWGEKYGVVIQSWRTKWHLLSAYFKYPKAIRKPIYTTNAVEAVHRQFRKLTKTKGLCCTNRRKIELF